MGPRPCGRGKMGGGDSEETESTLQGGLTVLASPYWREATGRREMGQGGRAHTIHSPATLDGRPVIYYGLLNQYLSLRLEFT